MHGPPAPGMPQGEQLLTLLSVFLSVQTVASQEGEMGDLCAAELHAEQLYGEVSDTPGHAGARTRASFRVGPPWGSHLVERERERETERERERENERERDRRSRVGYHNMVAWRKNPGVARAATHRRVGAESLRSVTSTDRPKTTAYPGLTPNVAQASKQARETGERDRIYLAQASGSREAAPSLALS